MRLTADDDVDGAAPEIYNLKYFNLVSQVEDDFVRKGLSSEIHTVS